ncbi:MAG: NIPSNAP family protein [Gemmobacter sp.]|nr:NIPSNAP family protein [Gemmobacter sp.]
MIVEERSYTFDAGKVPVFMAIYEEKGRAIQTSVLGRMLGYFTSDFGVQNQTVHLWGYDSLEDRQLRRDRLAALPDWQAFLREVLPLIRQQEVRILRPTAFSPIR